LSNDGNLASPAVRATASERSEMKATLQNCILLIILCAIPAAPQTPHFRFERQVFLPGTGPHRLAPDVSLIAGAAYSDLRDLRFYDSSGKEVPYLLIPPEAAEFRWKAGKLLPIAATKTSSGFEVDFGSSAPIDSLRLTGIPSPFLKRFRLEGSGDRNHWTLLVAEGILFDLPAESLRMLEVPFATGVFRYLRVMWDDRESALVPAPRSASARLVGAGNAAVPLRARAEFQRLSASPGSSRFQVRLPGPHLPLVALELAVSETRLLRTAHATESRLSGGELISKTLGSSTLRRVVQGNVAAADLRIPIGAPEGREIDVMVDDNDNPALNLSSVTLEFRPQPWIYLESSGDAPLVARFGDPQLVSPRYDLEAIRQYIGRTDLKEARWAESRDLQPAESFAEAGIQPPVGAAIDPKAFHYSRKIPDTPGGLTALVLDAAVLAHSEADLSDIRIADAGDHQIPYVIEKRPDPMALNVPLIPDNTAKTSAHQSHYRLALPFENLPAANVVLMTPEKTFQRQITLELARTASNSRSEPSSETLTSMSWRHDDPDSATPPLILALRPSLGTSTVMLTVDEGDNQPLTLSSARLELPLYRLRFFYPANVKLRLLYGQAGLEAARYDLELVAPRLVSVSSRELTLDPESTPPTVPEGNPVQTRVFWAALVIAVVVVLALLVRLLRSEMPGEHRAR
jgi:hypothetical protein